MGGVLNKLSKLKSRENSSAQVGNVFKQVMEETNLTPQPREAELLKRLQEFSSNPVAMALAFNPAGVGGGSIPNPIKRVTGGTPNIPANITPNIPATSGLTNVPLQVPFSEAAKGIIGKHPSQMNEEEFNIAEGKGMGVSWKNAMKLPDGTIIESSSREHGDMIPELEEEYDIDGKDMERGWTWKGFPKEQSYIGVPDVQKAKGSFYEAYKSLSPTGSLEDKLSTKPKGK